MAPVVRGGRAVPEAATAGAAEGTPAAAAELTAVVAAVTPPGVVSPPEVTTVAGIAVKTPLRHSAIKIATAIVTVTGIGNTRRTARMAWVTAMSVEA